MWKGRAEFLAPLTKMCVSKVVFVWNEEVQKAFEKVKHKIANDAMLTHPDFSKTFEIHADDSLLQIGGVISQDKKPIAFFSKKLNSAQRNCPITENELLSIVETLKEYKYLLLGWRIIVHTDHRNLTFDNTNHTCNRVLRQKLLLEE